MDAKAGAKWGAKGDARTKPHDSAGIDAEK
jgi:hypothetical protein